MKKSTLLVNNSNPFVLDGSIPLFSVKEGKAYLFAVENLPDGRTSARTNIATFSKGELIFGLPPVNNVSFIITGSLNTEIESVSVDKFLEEFGENKFSSALLKMSGNLQRFRAFKSSASLRKNQSEEYDADKELTSSTLRWVKAVPNCMSFCDEAISSWMPDGWFPVISRHSIYLTEPVSLSLTDTETLQKEGKLANLVLIYIQHLAFLLVKNNEQQKEKELDRTIEKLTRSDTVYSSSLYKIGSILESRESLVTDVTGDESPFVKAVQVVGKYSDIKIEALPNKTYDNNNGIAELSKDNNVQTRKVLLKGKWWKEDNGPLFAFMDLEDSEDPEKYIPVALLPSKSNSYLVVDPENNTQQIINEKISDKIVPSAYMFYRPLPDKKLNLKSLIKFCSKDIQRDFIRYLILGIMSALVGLLIPEITRIFMDSIIPQAAKNQALQISLLVLMCVLSAGAFDLVKNLAMLRIETKSDSGLQAAVMDRLLKLPVPFFKDYTAGDLAERTMAVSSIRAIISGSVISSLMTFIFGLVYLFQLFRYSTYLTGWGLLFCLVPMILTAVIGLYKYKWDRKISDIQGRIAGMLLQFINGMSKLVITASEKRAFAVRSKDFTEQKKCSYKASSAENVYQTFTSFFPIVVNLLFYAIFMKAIATEKVKDLTTGQFLAFMASFSSFQGALISMTAAFTQAIEIVPLYERAKPILYELPEIQEAKPSIGNLNGGIEINHVNFRYAPDTPLILKDVSLKIEPQEFIAIVGGSGSGKSTLLRLLLGFEKPESGSIYYDNQDMNSFDIGSLRRQMGVVLQNSSIMQGAIYDNIIGSTGLTIDDAWTAARMVGFDKDIEDMPMGMHTMIPAGGWTLSGGQRQRLIIARAIVRRPNVLFFDEATSALDNKTQAIVSRSLESLNVTRIVIAHRLSTIINADRIYVLQNGVIEESGSYNELMKKGGFFAELAKRQQV